MDLKTDSGIQEDKFTGNYFQWIKQEMQGWDTFPWALFAFGVGFELATLLLGTINAIAIVTFVGTFFGMWCTVAMGAGGYDKDGNRVVSHAINGLLGAISVLAYVYVNYKAGHWFSIVDQLIFFSLIDVELMATWRTWGRGKDSAVRVLSKKGWIYTIVSMLVAWGVLYELGLVLQDSNPIWDSLVLAIGATASWLCFRRYSTTYTLWLVEDVVNIILWATALHAGYSQAALPMLVMTLFYFATAIMGKINWKPRKAISKTVK